MGTIKSNRPRGTNTGYIEPSVYEAFRNPLRGELILPEDEPYDSARKIWNGMIDKLPAVIVRCRGNSDVLMSVKFAREHNLPIAVRGGGHNVSGSAVTDAGLIVDLSLMRSVRVDPQSRRVWAEGGAKLGDIDHETQAFGLAVPMGVVSKTGIAGLSLHGGMGFLSRKYGLTSDNILAADVVTADGRLIHTDEQNHPDLYWAIRGGGGNFGIVTSFEFQSYPVGPDVWLGLVFYPIEQAEMVLKTFRDVSQSWPDELNGIALIWSTPAEEPVPEEFRGVPVVVIAACYSGDVQMGEKAIQPIREITTPLFDLSGRIPYLEIQKLFDRDFPDGRRYYWKSVYLDHLNDEVIRTLIHHAAKRPSPISSLDVWLIGGEVNRKRPEETAFAYRNIPYMIGIESNWEHPAEDDVNINWSREVFKDLQRFSQGGSYLNFPGFAEEGESLIIRSYAGNYERLQSIKAKYDPDNFFRNNLNIVPAKS